MTFLKHKYELLTLEKDRKQMSIIESISSMYYCAIFIDVNKNTYEFVNDKAILRVFIKALIMLMECLVRCWILTM